MLFINLPINLLSFRILHILCFICFISVPSSAMACTTICLNQNAGPLVGANFDWPIGDGMIVINKRGFRKTAMSDPQKELNPVSWKSKYGSITFNFLGIDWPWGGMNAAGLVISSMQLEETQYPPVDDRLSIHRGQWVQYQLDNFSSVDQVIQNGDRLGIRNIENGYGAHYMAVDKSGRCAVIEFIGGRFMAYTDEKMPIKALANDPYARSLENTKRFTGFGGHRKIPDGNVSYCRFLKAASLLKQHRAGREKSTMDDAFEILHRVRYRNHSRTHTQWQVVYDIPSRLIAFKTRNNPTLRRIALNDIDYSCSRPTHLLDIHSNLEKEGLDAFLEYDVRINRIGFRHAFPKNPMKAKRNQRRLGRMSRYPETFVCEEN